MNGRERILALLQGGDPDRFPCMPITMQLAADLAGRRYLEYETDYRALVAGQVRVAEEFGLDYVNTMSDPACEAADCGAAVVFHPDLPAAMDESNPLLSDRSDLARLKAPDPARPGSRMHNRLRALEELKRQVGGSLLVEGWIEGPCAEAADLRSLSVLMLDFYDEPDFVHDLFEFVLAMELEFARHQVAAGAEMIGIGDAAASLAGPRIYQEFIWPYEKRMVEGVQALGARARLHICGDTRRLVEGMGRLGCDVVDLDFLCPLDAARAAMGPGQVLLGNIDPVRVLRDGTPTDVHAALAACHRAAGPRWIVGAGCEVPRDTPPENLRALVEYARAHAPREAAKD